MWWLRIGMCAMFVFAAPLLAVAEVRSPLPVVTPSASTQAVTPQQFQVSLEKQFRQQFPMQGVDFSVKILFPKQPILVPKGRVGIQFPPDTMNGRTGRRSIRGAVHGNDPFERMWNLVADISAHMQVGAPIRFIKAREILQPEDIHLIDVALPALRHNFLQHDDMAIGKKAVRHLSPNLPIQQPYLAEPPVIHKGDRVVLEVRQGSLIVQTGGIAKESGEPGKTIAVKNQASGREVIGQVVHAGLVKVLV